MKSREFFKRTRAVVLVFLFCASLLTSASADTSVFYLFQVDYVSRSSNVPAYHSHWAYWSQGASEYNLMNLYGCRVVAQAKMLRESNYTSLDPNAFNPDIYYIWAMDKGYFPKSETDLNEIYVDGKPGGAVLKWISDSGGQATRIEQPLTGTKQQQADLIMNYINSGYYVMVGCDPHYAYVGRDASLAYGFPVLLDSATGVAQWDGLTRKFTDYTQCNFNVMYAFSIPQGKAPVGQFSQASGGLGCIHVSGWARDDDEPNQPIAIHVYVGGPAGSGAPCYGIPADRYLSGIGNHGFDSTIYVSTSGTQTLYVYAIDYNNMGNNTLLGQKTVTIGQDTVPPVISNITITDLTWKGYTISCDVSDNVNVDRVIFPTWTKEDGDDDLIPDWPNTSRGTLANGRATYRVNVSEHGMQTGCDYITHIYAYDSAGNQVFATDAQYTPTISVPSPITDIRVSEVSAAGYRVDCDIDPEWDTQRVQFPSWSATDGMDDIVWHNPSIVNNHASCYISVSDHGNQTDCVYVTHIYAWDTNDHTAFGSLQVALHDPIPAPEIISVLENGNTLSIHWQESPLVNAMDQRTYTLGIYPAQSNIPSFYMEGITGSFVSIHPTNMSGSVADYIVKLTAVNETNGATSAEDYMPILFNGEFEAPETMELYRDSSMSVLDFLSKLTPTGEAAQAVERFWPSFMITSSDPSVIEVNDGVSAAYDPDRPLLTAKGIGSATLTVGFDGQSNTIRTIIIRVRTENVQDSILPANMEIIGEQAFLGASFVSIVIPEGCRAIGGQAFANSSTLERIYIPSSVTSIATDAFDNCPNLAIYCEEGTAAVLLARELHLPYYIVE